MKILSRRKKNSAAFVRRDRHLFPSKLRWSDDDIKGKKHGVCFRKK